MDDNLVVAERMMAPDDAYRLYILNRYDEDQYGMEVIRGAEHFHEYLSQRKDHVPLCKGPLKIVHDILRGVPVQGVEPAKIPFSPQYSDPARAEKKEKVTKTRRYRMYCDRMINFCSMDLLFRIEQFLKELDHNAEDDAADLAREIGEVIKHFRTRRRCPRCGEYLYLSDLPQYEYVCYTCEMNL